MRPLAGGEDREGVVDRVRQAGGGSQGVMAPPHGRGQLPSERGVAPEVLAQVAHGEGHVAGFVLKGEVGDAGGDRIGGVALDEGEQGEERPLAEHGEEKGGDGPLGLVEECLQ